MTRTKPVGHLCLSSLSTVHTYFAQHTCTQTLNKQKSGLKAFVVISSRNSLNTPCSSIPASSSPCRSGEVESSKQATIQTQQNINTQHILVEDQRDNCVLISHVAKVARQVSLLGLIVREQAGNK